MTRPRFFRGCVGLLCATQLLGACSVTQRQATSDRPVRRVHIAEEAGAAEMTQQLSRVFETKLGNDLFSRRLGIVPGEGYVLKWRPESVRPGSRTQRFFSAGFSGEGTFSVDAILLDPRNRCVARWVENGGQRCGFLGGSFSSAVEECAARLADNVRDYFEELDGAPRH